MGKLRYILEQARASLPLARTAWHVRRQFGKPLGAQIRELVALHRGAGRLKPFDYYAYGLYDDRRYTAEEKAQFISWMGDHLRRALNDPAWESVCDDKLMGYALFRALGLPHPPVQAFYHPGHRTCGTLPALRTAGDIAHFLRQGARYPLFGKPVRDFRGNGASSLLAYDPVYDVLHAERGEAIAVEQYVAAFPLAYARGNASADGEAPGYLFQSRVAQHPLVDRLSGGRVSTLRMIVLLGVAGPRLHRVTWKLPVGANITDHAIGTSGNVKCSIDPASGRVERVVRGPGPEGLDVYAIGAYGRPIERHPDTGELLSGVVLPCWNEIVSSCLQAATALPGMRYQGWDVAIGPRGPVFLECNPCSGIAQVAGSRGFYDDACRNFLQELGVTAEPRSRHHGGPLTAATRRS